jgi:hypothetical protein
MMWSTPRRLLVLVLVVVLLVTVATPAKAEAELLTGLAIATVVIAGVILIGYLVIANVEGSRRADEGPVVWLACAGEGCAVLTARAAATLVPAEPQTP